MISEYDSTITQGITFHLVIPALLLELSKACQEKSRGAEESTEPLDVVLPGLLLCKKLLRVAILNMSWMKFQAQDLAMSSPAHFTRPLPSGIFPFIGAYSP